MKATNVAGDAYQKNLKEMVTQLKELPRAHILIREDFMVFNICFEIPMMYLTLTIDCALKKYGVNGANIDWLTRNHWKESIRNSGYIEAEMYQEII